jgi:hypothetical protein
MEAPQKLSRQSEYNNNNLVCSFALHKEYTSQSDQDKQKKVVVQYLRCHSMRSCGEELGDAGGVEPMLREPNRRPEPSASSSDHNRIVRVIHHRVGLQSQAQTLVGISSSHKNREIDSKSKSCGI